MASGHLEERASTEGTPLGKNITRGTVAFVLLSAAGLAVLFLLFDEPLPEGTIRNIGFGLLALAILSAALDLPICAFRHHIFLRRLRPGTSFRLPLRAEVATRFSGAVTPSQSGGGPAQLFILHQGGVPVPQALSFLAINFMTNIVFFVVGGTVAAVVLADLLPAGTAGLLVKYGFASFLAASAAMAVLILRPRWMAFLLERLLERTGRTSGRIGRAVARGAGALLRICDTYSDTCDRFVHEDRGLIGQSLGLSVLIGLNRVTAGWLLVRALGVPADYATTVALLLLLQFALYLVPTPGGSGIAEVGTGALMALVLPAHLLGLFTFGYRAMMLYLPATAGAFVLLGALKKVARGAGVPSTVLAGLVLALALPPRAAADSTAEPPGGVTGLQGLHTGATDGDGPAVTTRAAPDAVPGHRTRLRDAPRAALETVAGHRDGRPTAPWSPLDTVPTCDARLLDTARETLVQGMALTDDEAARATFSRAETLAREATVCDPGSAEAHYLVAAALGLHLDRTGIRTKVRMVGDTRAEAEAALALDPSHAGAHHLLGRLHAGAMRLGRLHRFIAREFLGGDFLGEASWERAEEHFRRARDAEPGNPRYALELAVLYLDTGRTGLAVPELERATAAATTLPEDSAAVARARTLLESLGHAPPDPGEGDADPPPMFDGSPGDVGNSVEPGPDLQPHHPRRRLP